MTSAWRLAADCSMVDDGPGSQQSPISALLLLVSEQVRADKILKTALFDLRVIFPIHEFERREVVCVESHSKFAWTS